MEQKECAQAVYKDCRVTWEGTCLTAENSMLCRTWELGPQGLISRLWKDCETGCVFSRGPAHTLSPETGDILGDEPENLTGEVSLSPLETGGALPQARLTWEVTDDYGFAVPHLSAALQLDYPAFSLRYVLEAYPGQPLLRLRCFAKGGDTVVLKTVVALDSLAMEEKHCKWECAALHAVTDFHNNLVFSQEGLFYRNETRLLSGNILRLHRVCQNDGLVLVKESGAGGEQVRYGGWDFLLRDKTVSLVTAGYEREDLETGEYIPLYACACGCYHGGDASFSRWLFQYQHARHRFCPERDGRVVSNTWGDCGGGRNIDDDFLSRDMAAANEMGVEDYEIDAGWDSGAKDGQGRSLWSISERLPQRFQNAKRLAETYGMGLGAWFIPDTLGTRSYTAYREDAQILIDLYRRDGVRFFKLDGTKLLNYTSTWHLERMQQLVLEGTGNGAYFHMDITNWPRTGLLGGVQYSGLFWENRYTDRLCYYPHATLRSLWLAGRYFPLYRIQAEFLNVLRCDEGYLGEQPGDPLRPAAAGQLWAAAVTLFASPLVWMEPCSLPQELRSGVKELLAALGCERKELLACDCFPIGNTPDGVSITGFQSVRDVSGGWLLLLSEARGQQQSLLELESVRWGGAPRLECLASNCEGGISLEPVLENRLLLRFEKPFSYAVYRYTP